MAIAKMDKRPTTVWKGPSAISAGIGAGLALISLILLYSAFKTFMVRTNYKDASFKHDSNRRQEVRSAAEKARSWGRHAESTELLAKVLVETNQLDLAEKVYTEIAGGTRRGMGLCGLGVILLRRADAEKEAKKSADLARKAKDKFTEAKSAEPDLVEAQIGSATADLVVGLKLGEAAKIASAKNEFSKIHKGLASSEEAGARVTREGYMDLFVGLARSHASTSRFSPEALSFAGSARRYLPSSMGLYATELALQAQQMVENPAAPAEIRSARSYERLTQLNRKIISTANPKAMEGVADAWFTLTLATSTALARGGDDQDKKESKDLLELAKSRRGEDSLMASITEASLALETALVPEKNWNRRQTNYAQAHGKFKSVNDIRELQDPSRALIRATMLNNQAFFEEDYGAQGGGENRYQAAVALLTKALDAEVAAGLPLGSYEVRRNLAVIQKRRGKPEASEHSDAAMRLAADRSEEWVKRDLEELQKYILAETK
jgi:hypothetical protein